ncbi:MAG: hypothetical protein R3D56_00545 [Paracoccaceae bacterium]
MGSTTSRLAVIAALATLWPTYASPQQGGAGASGGLQVDIGVSTTLKYDDNFALTPGGATGDTFISDTKLSFGITSRTSAYDLSVLATGVVRFADIPGRSVSGFEDPELKLRFMTDSVNSRLTLTGAYRNVDREFLNPFQVEREEQQFGTLVGNGGTLRDTNLGLKYEVGLNAPLGFTLDLKHAQKDYSNVVNPRIFDTRTDSATGTLSFRLSPVATGRLSAGLSRYDADDAFQTVRTTTDYAVGLSYDINPVLTLDGQIGVTEVETVRNTGTTNRNGLSSNIRLTKSLPNGSVFGALTSGVNQNGRRTSLTFGRDLQLPLGNLRVSAGVTDAAIGSTGWIASIAYSRQMKADTFNLTFDRSASTNNNDQEVTDTRLGVDYTHPIDTLSRVRLSLDWGQQDAGSSVFAPANTIELTTLQASYIRDLTADWNLTGGVQYRLRKETGVADADSTALFVTLGRNFSFRP